MPKAASPGTRPRPVGRNAGSPPPPGPDLRDFDGLLGILKDGYGASNDVVIRQFLVGGRPKARAAVVYVDGMVDRRIVDQDIMRPLMELRPARGWIRNPEALAEALDNRVLPVGEMEITERYDNVIRRLMAGNTVVLLAGSPKALAIDTKAPPHRKPEAPRSEPNVISSFEGFTEHLRTNIVLVRRRIQSPGLRVRMFTAGRLSQNQVALMYLKDVANPTLVHAVSERLDNLGHEAHLLPSIAQSLLKENSRTPFPLFRDTERPDFVAQEILAGKVAMLTDNSPFAVVLPATFWDFFRTTEDYTRSSWGIGLLRGIRLVANLAGVYLPGLYIAFLSVNPEFLPTTLALGLVRLREGLAFPPVLEIILLLVAMEILREAAIRIPPAMGATLGVVGGIILGQALTQSRVVGPIALVVAALTGLAAFVTPAFEMSVALRLLLWPVLGAAVAFGLYGITLLAIFLLGHLCSLESLGVPYMAPVAPLSRSLLQDNILRTAMRLNVWRPDYLRPLRKIKQAVPGAPQRRKPGDGARGRRGP